MPNQLISGTVIKVNESPNPNSYIIEDREGIVTLPA